VGRTVVGAVNDHAEEHTQDTADAEVSVFQDSKVDDGRIGFHFPNHKSDERDHGNGREPANPQRGKPVVVLSLVEHDLLRGQPEGEETKADGVNLSGLIVVNVGRIGDIAANHPYGPQPDRDVDEKTQGQE